MIIYLLQEEALEKLIDFQEEEIICFSNSTFSDDNEFEIELDQQAVIKQRGYPLSLLELNTYYRHYQAWHNLQSSGQEYALIIENVQTINASKAELENLVATFESGWNMFFPFDVFARKHIPNTSYMIGFRVGTDAYFVHKSCLSLLLSQKRICRPIDEQILFFNKENALDIYYEELDIFSYRDSVKYEIDSEMSKQHQIMQMNLWAGEDLKSVRLLLAHVSEIFYKNEIDFFISEGTLLGHVRHQKIMSWDDDIDISVSISDIPKIIDQINATGTLKIIKRHWGKNKIEYYKIWHSDFNNIVGFPYGFPFIDIWLYDRSEESIFYNFGVNYPIKCIYPTKEVRFEGVQVRVPNDSLEYLDLKYKDWRERIVVYSWRHKLERANTFPLSIKIKVDDNGRIRQSFF